MYVSSTPYTIEALTLKYGHRPIYNIIHYNIEPYKVLLTLFGDVN